MVGVACFDGVWFPALEEFPSAAMQVRAVISVGLLVADEKSYAKARSQATSSEKNNGSSGMSLLLECIKFHAQQQRHLMLQMASDAKEDQRSNSRASDSDDVLRGGVAVNLMSCDGRPDRDRFEAKLTAAGFARGSTTEMCLMEWRAADVLEFQQPRSRI